MIKNYTNIKPGTKVEKELKYRNEPIEIDGIKFQSTKEGLRYSELKEQERIGIISNLELQPRFDININGKYIAFYKADFKYDKKIDVGVAGDWSEVTIEDVKSNATKKNSTYRLKKKIVEALYNIKILET